jgi:predicted glycosyltransferase
MRILIDIGHPGHVHFFKNLIYELRKNNEVKVIARKKEMVQQLLSFYEIKFDIIGINRKGLINKLMGYIGIIFRTIFLVGKFKPDILVGRVSPHLSIVSFLFRIPYICFTDTEHAKINYFVAYPFASVIVTPTSFLEDLGKKQIKINSYFELAYLHPTYFEPDPSVLDELGLTKEDKFAIIRFVSWGASHDIGIKGFGEKEKIRLVKEISKIVTPIITSEGKLPKQLQKYQIKIPPHRIHDALYYATIYVGEGATMASETNILGTPAILFNPLEMGVINDEKKYGILFHFNLDDEKIDIIINKINQILKEEKDNWLIKKNKLLKDKVDITSFMIKLIIDHPKV